LSEPEVLCEAIADGRHVSPTLLRLLCQAKGAEGIALITDATAGAGLPAESISCWAKPRAWSGMMLPLPKRRCPRGSTSSMIRGVRNMVELCGLSLVEAVQMASQNPARALRIDSIKEASPAAWMRTWSC